MAPYSSAGPRQQNNYWSAVPKCSQMCDSTHLPAMRRWTCYHAVQGHSHERSAFIVPLVSLSQSTICMNILIRQPLCHKAFLRTRLLCMLYSSFPSNLGRKLSPPRRSGELSSQMTPQNFSWDLSGVTVRYVVRRPSFNYTCAQHHELYLRTKAHTQCNAKE